MSTIVQSTATAPGRFGPYGGRYVPETLMVPLFELERAYEAAKSDTSFQAQFQDLLKNFAGRPTPLQFASRLTEKLSGPRIYLKREDLLHTGAHKINNAIGQGLLAVKMGKPRDRKSTRLNSSHSSTSYAVFCLKKKILGRLIL